MAKAWLPALLISLCCSLPVTAAELAVFAASSLNDALQEIARVYTQQQPDDRVLLNFAGSQTLAMQIEQGAPADLFISADQAVMERLQNSDLVTAVQPLLGNHLALAVRSDLRPALRSFADLARPNLLLIIGNQQVPVGRYTRQLFDTLAADNRYGPELLAQIKRNIVSEESRAKAIVAKLLLGEADAGFVYRSDISSAGLTGIPLPEELNPRAVYPLAKVKGGTAQASGFYDFLQSSAAAEIFRRHGFLSRSEL